MPTKKQTPRRRAVQARFEPAEYAELARFAKLERRSVAALVHLFVINRLAAERDVRTARPAAR